MILFHEERSVSPLKLNDQPIVKNNKELKVQLKQLNIFVQAVNVNTPV